MYKRAKHKTVSATKEDYELHRLWCNAVYDRGLCVSGFFSDESVIKLPLIFYLLSWISLQIKKKKDHVWVTLKSSIVSEMT